MAEHLVDVMDSRKTVIHTFPITIEGLEISVTLIMRGKPRRRQPTKNWCRTASFIA